MFTTFAEMTELKLTVLPFAMSDEDSLGDEDSLEGEPKEGDLEGIEEEPDEQEETE